jgi:hypothetical protein
VRHKRRRLRHTADYNIPRVKMFRTLGTSRTCASFTHEKMSGYS